jgi:peptide/nickel transport system substrate-binding protein
MVDQVGRRQFLRLSVMAAAGVAAVACQLQTVVVKETAEVDFLREDATIDNLALYKENADKANIRIQMLKMNGSPSDVVINQTYDDPVWCEVVRDVRFRRAVSHAMDRPTMIDAIYYGFAEMPKTVPGEYDPDLANQLLDEVGMSERDVDGFRLSPSGQPFEMAFDVSQEASDIVPVTEVVVENLKEIGINASMRVLEALLLFQRQEANTIKANVYWHHFPALWWGALWDAYPYEWGPLWNQWLSTNGESGEEPPEDVKELVAHANRSIVVASEERAAEIAAWRQLFYDNLYIITNVERVADPLIVNKDMRNVPTAGFAVAANFSLEQMWYDR